MEGPEEVETRFSYGRRVPPHPVLPLSCSLALRPLHPTVVFFFGSQLLTILCVLSFMSVAVMTLCSENCVLKHCCRDIYHSHLTREGGGQCCWLEGLWPFYMLCSLESQNEYAVLSMCSFWCQCLCEIALSFQLIICCLWLLGDFQWENKDLTQTTH